MEKESASILQIVAACQGAFTVGIVAVIFFYYITIPHKERKMTYHVLLVSFSYLCLTLATLISTYNHFYEFGDLWHWLVWMSYAAGDASLIPLLRVTARKYYELRRVRKLDELERGLKN